MAAARRAKKLVLIRSSGGVTRAVNGDVPPEPSTLRVASDSLSLSEVRIMRRPPPKQALLDAVKEARREIFSTVKSGDANALAAFAYDDASPPTPSPSPPPPSPPPPLSPRAIPCRVVPAPRTAHATAWGEACTLQQAQNASLPRKAETMYVFTERDLPPTCRHCNVLFVTFASVDCGHADACFACAFRKVH